MEKTIRKTREIVVEQMLTNTRFSDGNSILEPSAGSGDLVEGIIKYADGIDISIDVIELNRELRNTLKSKGFNVVGEDFLKFNTDKRYDYIIACPTYKDNVDLQHIMHMYGFLKSGGQIISLTHPVWTVKNSDLQVEFRKWLADKKYSLKMLVDNSYVEDYRTQPSMIIKIIK
jgi:SAM-dependent methyltransferase